MFISLAVANQPCFGFFTAGKISGRIRPFHSYRPSPGTGVRPSQLGRRGVKAEGRQPMSPAVSA